MRLRHNNSAVGRYAALSNLSRRIHRLETEITFNSRSVRAEFPALDRLVSGRPAVYLDGPGGTQMPNAVIEAVAAAMRTSASNLGGHFAASKDSDAIIAGARQAAADLINAGGPREIVFGQNMTSLTFAASSAIAATWQPGDEIVVTTLDHDANVRPWVLAAERRGVEVRYAEFDLEPECLLPADALVAQITAKTRLVAVTRASNALGTMVDVAAVAEAAHAVGALCYVDAVHYAPHGPIDVQAIGCDFLTVSAYKFFGPHTGVMYGRAEVLAELEPSRLRLSPEDPPERWETGTQSFESLAGVAAAVDYLAGLGSGPDRRAALVSAMTRISDYEQSLSDSFLAGLAEISGISLFGPSTSSGRTPTFSIAIDGISPPDAARELGRRGIFAWSGHNYAVGVMERLDRLDKGGLLRIGFVHYTLPEEVDAVLEALQDLA